MQRPPSIAHTAGSLRLNRPTNNRSTNPNNNRNMSSQQQSSTSSPMELSPESNWCVNNDSLRDVPNFYPLEKTSKFVSAFPNLIAHRISDCCRIMSVQVSYDHELATADLITPEHVEIHISLWKSSSTPTSPTSSTSSTSSTTPVTIVEAQRRKGDAVTFYKYCRNILSAANGSFFDADYLHSTKQEQRNKVERQAAIIKQIKRDKLEKQKSLPQQQDEQPAALPTESEDALLALEIAASLIKKDRMDARQLGMETLCLLTDPSKSGIQTAVLASKVVLFGAVDAHHESIEDIYMPTEELGIREAILSLIQYGKLSEYIDFEEEDEQHGGGGIVGEEKEINALLHNLALAVLSNALDVLKQHAREMAKAGNPSSTAPAAAASANNDHHNIPTANANAFLDETKLISKKELLSTLLNVLSNAQAKPHDACLSAQCLKSLFQASKKAKRRARDLNAKQIVNTALEVGRRTHLKLEQETKCVMKELQKTDDLDDNNSEHEEDSEVDDSDNGEHDE